MGDSIPREGGWLGLWLGGILFTTQPGSMSYWSYGDLQENLYIITPSTSPSLKNKISGQK